MKDFIKCGFAFLFFLCFCAIIWADQNDWGGEGASSLAQERDHTRTWLEALSDGDHPLTTQQRVDLSAKGVLDHPREDDSKRTLEVQNVYTPVWKGLNKLSSPERENAVLQLDLFGDLSSSEAREIDHIEALWNGGDYERAVEKLRIFEESHDQPDIRAVMTPKTQMMVSDPKWGTDIRIGSREGVEETCLDFDQGTGNLFAVVKSYDGEYWRFDVYFSSDDGQTWWDQLLGWGPSEINDISGVVLHGYFYFAETASSNKKIAIRRFDVSSGTPDDDYGTVIVVDGDYDVLEIALTGNADFYDNRLYLLAILQSDSLIHLWSTEEAVFWQNITTYVADADHGLDACCNEGYAEWVLFVSYVDVDDSLHVVRKSAAAWQNIKLDYAGDKTSVAAYDDRIITAFEYLFPNGRGIKYWISYDGGEEWRWGAIAEPEPGGFYFYAPAVAARKGAGIGVVYEQEVGEPDPCWYRYREYGTGPGTASWSDPEQFNEQDLATGSPMTIEWVPPLPLYCHAHGTIWIGGSGQGAYFDRMDRVMPGDVTGDEAVDVADVMNLINYLFIGGSAPDPLWIGDCNCDEAVDVADVMYLINYLFIGGSPPLCC
jgi:hypothetical protein